MDDDWPEVVGNLTKVRKRWAWMSRILGREGADPWTAGKKFNVVVQVTRLFSTESWVMSPWIGRTLGESHHRVARQLAKMQDKRDMVGRWIYLPLDAEMKAEGSEEVETYVLRRQNTVASILSPGRYWSYIWRLSNIRGRGC